MTDEPARTWQSKLYAMWWRPGMSWRIALAGGLVAALFTAGSIALASPVLTIFWAIGTVAYLATARYEYLRQRDTKR